MSPTSEGANAPTIKDVAERANVHHSTASRALRGNPDIHAETALRVRAAAAELGYQPNLHAQALRDQKSKPVVAVITDPVSVDHLSRFAQPFWLSLLLGTTNHLAQAGIGVVQVTTEATELLEALPIRALLVLSIDDTLITLPSSLANVPLIAGRTDALATAASATIGHDHEAIAYEACGYLGDCGAHRVAYLPLSNHDQLSIAAATGYRRWCAERGRDVVVLEPIIDPSDSEGIRAAVRAGVDGIFATTGELATLAGAIAAEGLVCPDDVQVVCIGEGVFERLMSPQLTSVNLFGAQCGRDIAELMRRVVAREPVASVTFAHQLIPRQSTRS